VIADPAAGVVEGFLDRRGHRQKVLTGGGFELDRVGDELPLPRRSGPGRDVEALGAAHRGARGRWRTEVVALGASRDTDATDPDATGPRS